MSYSAVAIKAAEILNKTKTPHWFVEVPTLAEGRCRHQDETTITINFTLQ